MAHAGSPGRVPPPPSNYFRRLLKESPVAIHHERSARVDRSAQVVAQMGCMPLSGDACFAKYCRSHLAVGSARVPPVQDLQQTGKSECSPIRRVETGAKATVCDHIGKSCNGLYPCRERSRRQYDLSGETGGFQGLDSLDFQLEKSARRDGCTRVDPFRQVYVTGNGKIGA